MNMAQMWLLWSAGCGLILSALAIQLLAGFYLPPTMQTTRRVLRVALFVAILGYITVGGSIGITQILTNSPAANAEPAPQSIVAISIALVAVGVYGLIRNIYRAPDWRGMRTVNKLIFSGRGADALAICDQILARKPKYASAWIGRATALNLTDRYTESLDASEHALKFKRQRALAWLSKGMSFLNMRRDEAALLACDHALSLSLNIESVSVIRALALLRLGRLQEASAACDRARWIDAKKPLFWIAQARVLDAMAQHEEALASAERALHLDAKSPVAWATKATILAHLRRDQEAQTAATQALATATTVLAARPAYISAWEAKADALRLLGREDESRAAEAHMRALLGA